MGGVASIEATATVSQLEAQIALAEDLIGDVLTNEATIDINVDLLGAGKKRKKKTYTKPKKIKHKHKKVKLAVLKFYKVDGEKIVKLRRECPNCGEGVFLAMHPDRYYCGKCT